jgi:hypothetical protein
MAMEGRLADDLEPALPIEIDVGLRTRFEVARQARCVGPGGPQLDER